MCAAVFLPISWQQLGAALLCAGFFDEVGVGDDATRHHSPLVLDEILLFSLRPPRVYLDGSVGR